MWKLKTVVFLHGCLICTVLLAYYLNNTFDFFPSYFNAVQSFVIFPTFSSRQNSTLKLICLKNLIGFVECNFKVSLHVRFRIKLAPSREQKITYYQNVLANAKSDSRVNEPLSMV